MISKEFNITVDTKFVITKLVSGEQVIGVLRNETPGSIQVEYPMLVSSVKFQTPNGEVGAHTTAEPFCKFSEDRLFVFDKRMLQFTKSLHKYAIPFYLNLLQEYEAYVDVPDPDSIEELTAQFDEIAREVREKQEELEQEEALKQPIPKTYH